MSCPSLDANATFFPSPKVLDNKDAHRIRWRLVIAFVSILFLASTAFAAEPFSMEAVKARASDALPQKVVDALDPEGLSIFTYANGIKAPVCEIFWAKVIASKARPVSLRNAPYRNIEEGSFVGVIHFPADASEQYREDFHDRKLQPGYYTMRYTVLPDGDTGDFVVLSPVNLDHDPENEESREELVRRSKLASRTDDPAVLSLIPIDGSESKSPALRTEDAGTCIIQVKLHAKPSGPGGQSEVTLAILVATPLEEEGGS